MEKQFQHIKVNDLSYKLQRLKQRYLQEHQIKKKQIEKRIDALETEIKILRASRERLKSISGQTPNREITDNIYKYTKLIKEKEYEIKTLIYQYKKDDKDYELQFRLLNQTKIPESEIEIVEKYFDDITKEIIYCCLIKSISPQDKIFGSNILEGKTRSDIIFIGLISDKQVIYDGKSKAWKQIELNIDEKRNPIKSVSFKDFYGKVFINESYKQYDDW